MDKGAPPAAGHAGPGQYLTFLLAAERFAMPTGPIREIVGFSSLTEVPLMPDFLRGVINVRGAVVPVMDLSLRLGLDATVFGKRTCVVILDLRHRKKIWSVGALVDAAHAVATLDASRFDQPAVAHPRIPPEFIHGTLELDGRPVISLDIQRIFEAEELVELVGGAGSRHVAVAFSGEREGMP
ncbi:purine-binding chemotaxis protein CheW [Alcaligenaceae bacterium]|nr:purine-binding chemotaxis protein CheW [Alcaligenaceae bacterium]